MSQALALASAVTLLIGRVVGDTSPAFTRIAKRQDQPVITKTITEADTAGGDNPFGSVTSAQTAAPLSWSAVSASYSIDGAPLATTTDPPSRPKPTPTENIDISISLSISVGVSLGTTTTATCAPTYSATSTLYGARGTLPRPTSFVKRASNGSRLVDDSNIYTNNTYRAVGANIYWLGLDENVQPNPSYPDKGRIREAIAIVAAMGGNTIRSQTLGVSVGNDLSIWPDIGGTFNDKAFDSIDYSIAAIRNYGLRAIIPLTDNYNYYHGGKMTFLAAYGYNITDKAVGGYFYNDSRVIASYKQYISQILSHVNTYTGVAYKDDPTILAWETGNELGAYMLQQGAPPANWTSEITSYIRGIDPNHLIIDGSDGTHNSAGSPIPGLGVDTVDTVSDHLYPLSNSIFRVDISLANPAQKNLLIGEYDWTGLNGGSPLPDFLSAVEASPDSGDLLWSIFGHDADCCNFVTHNDGYALYYPNGNGPALENNVLQIAQHWYRLTDRPPPSSLPAVACPQPWFIP